MKQTIEKSLGSENVVIDINQLSSDDLENATLFYKKMKKKEKKCHILYKYGPANVLSLNVLLNFAVPFITGKLFVHTVRYLLFIKPGVKNHTDVLIFHTDVCFQTKANIYDGR